MSLKEDNVKLQLSRPLCNCKGCPNHKYGCKETCESWKQYEQDKAEWDKQREKQVKANHRWFDSVEMNKKYQNERKKHGKRV